MLVTAKREESEIKMIRILTQPLESGWVIEIQYKDNKHATFSVDYGKGSESMISLSCDAIRRQLRGSNKH